ncbi:TPA: hypothetical protein CPT87_05060 [Candidatus Gastranaerophilales bacterium HUM_5]|nr:MAG TPA: hypothetical protein CPT99_02100 [Candidatus Gastranaerophilales bacterium HUM_4]DAA90588.1 MAG TPA: hypothetical protein CPT87_05060 [Candidatus Gastranaerophilales bacterium HUM_5]
MRLLYKFRSTKYLIEELTNNELYFADLNELNDPMETFKNIVWQGDEILWCNLFNHYLLCLDFIHAWHCFGNDEKLTLNDIPIFATVDNLPDELNKEMFKFTQKIFFENFEIRKIAKLLSKKRAAVQKEELIYYLSEIHYLALVAIRYTYKKYNVRPYAITLKKANERKIQQKLKKIIKDSNRKRLCEAQIKAFVITLSKELAKKREIIQQEMFLEYEVKYDDNQKFIYFDYPKCFIERLQDLMYPKCYISCFSNSYKNPVMWGHYSEGHKGACLIFKNKKSLSLRVMNGCDNNVSDWEDDNIQLFKINYNKELPPINFFTEIGQLSREAKIKYWKTFNNQKSTFDIYNGMNSKEWRKRHWKLLYNTIVMKDKCWKYEHEYRLILLSIIHNKYQISNNRKIQFDTSELVGVILGAKMKISDKLQIRKIINEKYNVDKEKVKIYEAYLENGKVKITS